MDRVVLDLVVGKQMKKKRTSEWRGWLTWLDRKECPLYEKDFPKAFIPSPPHRLGLLKKSIMTLYGAGDTGRPFAVFIYD